MKTKIAVSIVMMFSLVAYAQDTIISKNGSELIAHVVEINKRKTVVTIPSKGGETYHLKNKKIQTIKFQDSVQKVFNPTVTKEQRRAYGMKQVMQYGMDRSLGVEFMNPAFGLRYNHRLGKSRFYLSGSLNFNAGKGVFAFQSSFVDVREFSYGHEKEYFYLRSVGNSSDFNHGNARFEGSHTYNKVVGYYWGYSNHDMGAYNSFTLKNGEQLNPEFHLPGNIVNQLSLPEYQAELGFRFHLRSDTKRFRPFLSAAAGIGSVRYYKATTLIKFKDEIGLEYGRLEDRYIYSIERIRKSALSLNAHLGFGIEWAISSKWAISTDCVFSFYQCNMGSSLVQMNYKDGRVQNITSKNTVGTFSTVFIPITFAFKI